MASFISSLVGGYANTLIQKHKEERDREDKSKEAELALIQSAINSGQLPPDQMRAAFERSEEIINEYTGKKSKGQFSLKNLIGQFPDTNQQKTSPAASTSAAPQNRTAAASPAAAQPKVSLGAPPARQGTPAAPAGASFSPQFQDPTDMEVQRTRKIFNEQSSERQDEIKQASKAYKQAFPNATPADIYRDVVAPKLGLKEPIKAETKQIKDKNSPTGWSWRTSDMNTGQQIGQNVLGAPPPASEKPTTAEENKENIIQARMAARGETHAQAELWYDKNLSKQFEQKGQPTTSTSTTVQTTPQGPAVTQQTTTVRGKGGAQALGVGQDVLTPSGTPKHNELQWAVPKEGRTAIRKAQDAYEDANARYAVMKETLAKIQKDPQAAGQGDILILSNHIGMTWSAQKGGRIPITIWNEARKSRPFLQGLQVKIEGGFVTGAILTPQQRQYMIDLADEQSRIAHAKELDEEVRYGVMFKVTPVKGPDAGKIGYISRQAYEANPGIYKKVP
jgi:hypothetical protein